MLGGATLTHVPPARQLKLSRHIFGRFDFRIELRRSEANSPTRQSRSSSLPRDPLSVVHLTIINMHSRTLPRRLLAHDIAPGLICRSCRLQRRQFASAAASTTISDSTSRFPPKPPTAGLTALPSRQLLSVAGPDATKLLQGVVTANLQAADGQPRTDPFYAAFLNATGRVVHDVFIYPYQPTGGEGIGYYIEADAKQIDHMFKYVKRYKLRAKVNFRKFAPDEATIWQAWDDTAGANPAPAASESSIILRDPRVRDLGYRILQLNDRTPDVDLDQTTEDAYTIRRYLRGVPEGQDEILRESALPLDCNMEFMDAIDFRKGCYVGQELTIRTKHRGVVRKRVLPCMVYDKDAPAPTTLEYDPESAGAVTADAVPSETSIGRSGKRGRSAGKWLQGVGNLGLGLCRLEVMTDVVLLGEQTWSPADEFVLDWGEGEDQKGVKVKAFVPDWLREGIAASPPPSH